MSKKRVEAVAYLRTSSPTNVGPDKDSDKRQRDAIEAFARRAGYAIVEEFYDAAVKGADPVQERPGFAALLERLRGNGVRTIIVETANRFARERAILGLVKRAAARAGLEAPVSPHWLRHAHASHAIDRGAPHFPSPIDTGARQHRHDERLLARRGRSCRAG